MTDKIQALAQSIAEEFGAITVGGHGDTRGEYAVVDASPEEVARFLAPKLIQPEWISVDDRLPEDETPVLVCILGDVRILERRWENPGFEDTFKPFWYWDDPFDDGQDFEMAHISHWMPLPNIPEVKP